jgi:hypothetical protein
MLLLFVIYGGAGLVMWLVAHQMAPVGREIPLSRAVFTVILMGLCSAALEYWVKPIIGDWSYLLEFVSSILIVMAMFELKFWRSFFAVLIYWVVIVAGIVGMTVIAHSHP